MADQLGSAVLTLTVDDKQFNAGLSKAKLNADKALGGIGAGGGGGGGASAAGVFAAISGAAAPAALAAAAVGVAVVGIGAAAVQSAGSIQKLNAAFTGLTGSAEAAKQLRQDLFTLSKTTPFKNEDILQAAQRFLAVGVNVNNLQGTINRVGAIAAQSGQPLERLALIYAQVYAKGRLQGEENLQLLEAGVDLTQELSAVTGLSGTALQDAMSKGKIGVDSFNKALSLATGDMASLQQAGQAVDVQFNNVFDNLSQLFGGFATSISPALSAAFGVVNQVLDEAFPSLESIQQLFAPLTASAQQFSQALEGNPQLIGAIAAATREWAGIIINNVADGLTFVTDLINRIDGKKLVKSFVDVELAIRRSFLAASALGAQIAKNAELSIRGVSNPIQFGQDIAAAGGFGKFIEQEYAGVKAKWEAVVKANPLEFPAIKPAGKDALKGDLSSKPVGPDKTLLAQQQQQRAESQLALQTVQQRIAAAKELASVEAGVVRQTIQQRQEIEAGVQASKDQIARIGAQIDALRLQGGDNAPQLQKLVDEQKVAATEIRLKLIEGATALKDAGKQLKQDLGSAVLELAGIRNDPGGLNQYLNQQQIQERGQATLQSLLPQFREAQARFTQLTGAQAPEFRGTTSGVIDSVRQFIERVNSEFNAGQNVANLQEALNKNTADLVTVNNELLTVTRALAEKSWAVNVNVPGGNATGDVVGAVNGAF